MSRFLLAVLALAAMPVLAHADGFVDQLAQYDLNGNGLLEPHERAMTAVAEASDVSALSARPVICDHDADGSASGESSSSIGSEVAGGDEAAAPPHLQWEPVIARHPAPGEGPDVEEPRLASETEYTRSAPAQPQQRQPVQIRSAVQYRMLLNDAQAQPRSQPFARAATFGPMVGRVKQHPRRYFNVALHDTCACSRASLYLGGY